MQEYYLCPACAKRIAIKSGRMNIGPKQRYKCKNQQCGIKFSFDKEFQYPNKPTIELIVEVIGQKKRELDKSLLKIKENKAQLKKLNQEFNKEKAHLQNLINKQNELLAKQ
ncbi:MAG: hypothetical protein EPN82_05790 [Bacteroidetes bacterium]|nr:MAG: hypothetical protein EPN82_05790 [Bacteroidota bacterium]